MKMMYCSPIVKNSGETRKMTELERFCQAAGIDHTHGRIGKPEEYHEFDGHTTDGARYIAQRSGEDWFVYRSLPGKKGQVRTLFSFKSADTAAMYAAFSCSTNLKGE